MPKKKITDPKASNAITLLSGNRLPIDLKDGLTIGSVTYKIAVLRQLNAGDVQEASEASERLVSTPTGDFALVSSPARMGREMLRRQVARLEDDNGGTFNGPLEPEDMARLTVTDLSALQMGVAILDAHVEKAVEAMGKRGRTDAGSAAPADAGSAAGQPG